MELLVGVVVLAIVVGLVVFTRGAAKARSAVSFPALSPEKRAALMMEVDEGRLPVVEDIHLALRRKEVPHLQLQAELMKDVVDREYRGRNSGVSFRIAKGVRYHTGSSRGHLVTVGSHLEVADRGQLTVTSQRTVFTGFRRTIEIPHSRVVQVVAFVNGVQLHASNRVNPPLFRVARDDAALLSVIVSGAQQRAVPASTDI